MQLYVVQVPYIIIFSNEQIQTLMVPVHAQILKDKVSGIYFAAFAAPSCIALHITCTTFLCPFDLLYISVIASEGIRLSHIGMPC